MQDDNKELLEHRIYILSQTFLALMLPAIMIPMTCPLYLLRRISHRICYATKSGSRTAST